MLVMDGMMVVILGFISKRAGISFKTDNPADY